MNDKLKKILSEPKVFDINGQDVTIYPLDYEDTLRLMSMKKDSTGKIDMIANKDVLDKLMKKKLKQSYTVTNESGIKDIPTDEDINKIDGIFYIKYTNKLFTMLNEGVSGIKKKWVRLGKVELVVRIQWVKHILF